MSIPTDSLEDRDQDEGDSSVSNTASSESETLAEKRITLIGRFGGMNQKQAANVLRSYDAVIVDQDDSNLDWIVIGAEESLLAEADLLSSRMRDSAARGEVEVIHETDLWQRLGLVDIEQSVRRYHTPAMLAHLLDVSVHVIRDGREEA